MEILLSQNIIFTSRQDSVGIQVFPDINITFHDGIVYGFMNTARFHTQEGWLEQGLRTTETFISDSDNLTVRQFI